MLENLVSLSRGANSNSSLSTFHLQPMVLPLHAMPLGRGLTGGGLHARTRAQCGREPLRFVLVASAVFRGSYVRVV